MALNKKTVRDVDLKNKRVLIRCDFNVPQDENLSITDDARIVASLPTIQYCLDHGASVVAMSHLGRPKGEKTEKYSLKPVAKRMGELLGQTVQLAPDCIGPEVEKMAQALKPGKVLLLENTRFHKGEEKNDEGISKQLAALGNVYVLDAFGSSHRAHSSTEGVTKFLRPAVAGFLMEKELEFLENKLSEPKRPFVALIGGAKVSTKIAVLENLLSKVDVLLIGGAMAFTFTKAQGGKIGNSLCEDEFLDTARKVLEKAASSGTEFILPVDAVVVQNVEAGAPSKVVRQNEVPDGWKGVDIGPETLKQFRDRLLKAQTVFWNGPVGVFEIADFSKGTFAIAELLAEANAVTVIGGGDSASAVRKAGLEEKMTHISTGGGASLELVEGKILPGVAALDDRD